jgi:hypothetical protein
MNRIVISTLCTLAFVGPNALSQPITMAFSGAVISSSSNVSWSGAPLSGTFTIYPENFKSEYSHYGDTYSHLYTFVGPAYGNTDSPAIDYTVNLPDGSVFRAPHENAYAEWGSVAVHHLYVDGPSEETYQIGETFQPADRSYQADFYIILENALHDGALVSNTSINQVPNPLFATYENAGLTIFNYRSMSSPLDIKFSINSIEPAPVPEPETWGLMFTGIGGLLLARRRQALAQQ